MECFKEKLIRYCKYSACALFLTALTVPVSAFAGDSGKNDISGRKFCVVLRPDVKPSPGTEKILVGEPAADTGSVRGIGSTSFFEGTVQKLGFGTPDCFFINGQIKSNPVTGDEGLHAGPDERLEAIATERHGRDFFPTAGFFNRTSFGNRGGLAIGAGLAGSSSLEGDEGTTPQAKVSLMFGFGF